MTLFKVKNLAGLFDNYERFNKSSVISPNRVHNPNIDGPQIGREGSATSGYWYSFPKDGAWDGERVHQIPFNEIWDTAIEAYKKKNNIQRELMYADYQEVDFVTAIKSHFLKYMN
jgi:hypothetical protein